MILRSSQVSLSHRPFNYLDDASSGQDIEGLPTLSGLLVVFLFAYLPRARSPFPLFSFFHVTTRFAFFEEGNSHYAGFPFKSSFSSMGFFSLSFGKDDFD